MKRVWYSGVVEFKNFQIIIGCIFIGLSIVLGSVIFTNNTGFNACYKKEYERLGKTGIYRFWEKDSDYSDSQPVTDQKKRGYGYSEM